MARGERDAEGPAGDAAAGGPRGGPAGLYLHLPFCASRCAYCTFVTSTELHLMPRAMAALADEVERLGRGGQRPLGSLYLGGGTPSLVDTGPLERVFAAVRRSFRLVPGAEITLEANPDDVTEAKLVHWSRLGVTRVSLGVQAFDDRVLSLLSRRHSAAQAREATRLALAAGFTVSVDIMLGLPGLQPDDLAADLAEIATLRPHHVSVYLLELDKPHALARLAARRPDLFPGDDAAAAQYRAVGRGLVAAGYRHYEISNFCLPGRHARHNTRYWLGRTVLAAGVGAHGQAGRRRWANVADLAGWLTRVERGEVTREWSRRLDQDEQLKERVMLGLRLARGVDEARIARARQLAPAFGATLDDFLGLGLARRRAGRIRLAPRGWLVSNELFAALW